MTWPSVGCSGSFYIKIGLYWSHWLSAIWPTRSVRALARVRDEELRKEEDDSTVIITQALSISLVIFHFMILHCFLLHFRTHRASYLASYSLLPTPLLTTLLPCLFVLSFLSPRFPVILPRPRGPLPVCLFVCLSVCLSARDQAVVDDFTIWQVHVEASMWLSTIGAN